MELPLCSSADLNTDSSRIIIIQKGFRDNAVFEAERICGNSLPDHRVRSFLYSGKRLGIEEVSN